MKLHHCNVCFDDIEAHVEAKFRCTTCDLYLCFSDGKRHAKKESTHVVEELKDEIPICSDHQFPINSFASTQSYH